MADLDIFMGNTAPRPTEAITSSGEPVDLSLASVRFRMRNTAAPGLKVDAAADVVDGPAGRVSYDWVADDTDTVGEFRAWWTVTIDGEDQDTPEFSVAVLAHAEVPTTGLITVADLDARRISYEDVAQAQAAIEDASAVARSYVSPVLDDVVRGGDPDVPQAVIPVVAGMVRRVLTNPVGLSMEVLGDYTYQAGSNAVATLLPTQRERRLLRRAAASFAKANGIAFEALGSGSAWMSGVLPVVSDDVGLA